MSVDIERKRNCIKKIHNNCIYCQASESVDAFTFVFVRSEHTLSVDICECEHAHTEQFKRLNSMSVLELGLLCVNEPHVLIYSFGFLLIMKRLIFPLKTVSHRSTVGSSYIKCEREPDFLETYYGLIYSS